MPDGDVRRRLGWWRDPIRAVRYRIGAWFLRPLIVKVARTAGETLRPQVPDRPSIGGDDEFDGVQAWAEGLTKRDAVSARVRAEQSAVRELYGLARAWPYNGWDQVTQDRLAREGARNVNPISTVYDLDGNMHRYAERLHGLSVRNDGLVNLITRMYWHFIDDMPDELADELEQQLGMQRRRMLTTRGVSDEGWDTPTQDQAG